MLFFYSAAEISLSTPTPSVWEQHLERSREAVRIHGSLGKKGSFVQTFLLQTQEDNSSFDAFLVTGWLLTDTLTEHTIHFPWES